MVNPLLLRLAAPFVLLSALACATGSGAGEGEGEGEGDPDPFAAYDEPLPTAPGAWTYTLVDGAVCGDGSPVGAISNGGSTTDVLIYFEGGGACWDNFSCNQGIAAFVRSGITTADIDAFTRGLGTRGIFDRDDALNPFANHSFIYVPYCTGDLHIGTRAQTPHNVAHAGALNTEAILRRVIPAFPDAERIVVAGASAGGFGALLNTSRVARHADATTGAQVTSLIDSAPPLPTDETGAALWATQIAAWQPEVDGCADCTDVNGTFLHLMNTRPDARIALVLSTQDETLRFFFGLGQTPATTSMPAATYEALIRGFVDTLEPAGPAQAFVVASDEHVFVYNDVGTVRSGGVNLSQFLYSFVDGDDGFVTTLP